MDMWWGSSKDPVNPNVPALYEMMDAQGRKKLLLLTLKSAMWLTPFCAKKFFFLQFKVSNLPRLKILFLFLHQHKSDDDIEVFSEVFQYNFILGSKVMTFVSLEFTSRPRESLKLRKLREKAA